MTTGHALKIAMGNEQRAHDFYFEISKDSPDPDVRAIAAEFADEEKEHLELLEKWLEDHPGSEDEAPYDPDPPHMPE
jgi:rubrerythrin